MPTDSPAEPEDRNSYSTSLLVHVIIRSQSQLVSPGKGGKRGGGGGGAGGACVELEKQHIHMFCTDFNLTHVANSRERTEKRGENKQKTNYTIQN